MSKPPATSKSEVPAANDSLASTADTMSDFELLNYDEEEDRSPVDTLSASAALKNRREERERRLAEIESTFQHVVEESQTQEDGIYCSVFLEDGEVHNQEVIGDMQTKIKENDTMLNRVAETLSIKKKDPQFPFRPSPTGVSSFDDKLPGFFPPDEYESSHSHLSQNGRYNGNRSASTGVVMGKLREFDMRAKKYRIAVMLVLFLCVIVTLMVTNLDTSDTGDEAYSSGTAVDSLVWKKFDIIRKNLVKQGVNNGPLKSTSSPQYSAVMQLAEEVAEGYLNIGSIEDGTSAVRFEVGADGQVQSVNKVYIEQRNLLERYSILTFYRITQNSSSDPWTKSTNWGQKDIGICDGWFGITCGNVILGSDVKAVKSITLDGNSLEGSLPEELAYLYSLEILHLDDNKLQGGVPKSLGQLKALKSLDLSKNKLSGEFPNEICLLKKEPYNLQDVVISCSDMECSCCDCV